MQIHVDLSKPTHRQITIFSKSKRDSTLDRAGTHSYVQISDNISIFTFKVLLVSSVLHLDFANRLKPKAYNQLLRYSFSGPQAKRAILNTC